MRDSALAWIRLAHDFDKPKLAPCFLDGRTLKVDGFQQFALLFGQRRQPLLNGATVLSRFDQRLGRVTAALLRPGRAPKAHTLR